MTGTACISRLHKSSLALPDITVADLLQQLQRANRREGVRWSTCLSATAPVTPCPFNTCPIGNISPWATLFTSLRHRQAEEWRSWVLPDSTHGPRRGHEIGDVAHELALECELAHAKKQHLGGVSLDRNKFFDLLPFDLCFELLAYMGHQRRKGILQTVVLHAQGCWCSQ